MSSYQTCEYFAFCDNPADVIIHDSLPIIGDVPTCKECNARLLSGNMGPDERTRSTWKEATQ